MHQTYQLLPFKKTNGINPITTRHFSFVNHVILHASFTNYSIKQGLKKWGDEGHESVMNEMTGMETGSVFEPKNGMN